MNILEKPIAEIGLRARGHNALLKSGCKTIGDLTNKRIDELHKIKNLGCTSVRLIVKKLKGWGLTLAKPKDEKTT